MEKPCLVLALAAGASSEPHFARDLIRRADHEFSCLRNLFRLLTTLSPTFNSDSNTLLMKAPLSPLRMLAASRCQANAQRCVRWFSGMSISGLSSSQVEVRNAVQKMCQAFPDEYWSEKDRYVKKIHLVSLLTSHC